MLDICTELPDLLSTVQRPGEFFASGRLALMPPRLVVDGVGPIALPLLASQASQLIAVAERAPYGRGADTIVDTEVRRSWQIPPERIDIGGKHWSTTLDGAVALAAAGLGVDGPVAAVLYKLLVYNEGSFFVSHRDTEKEPGMFATMVLALPSTSAGGELVVRHLDREARFDLANDDPSELTFAAFYADCLHEVLPVTSGCRATLVYNLIRTGSGERLQPPDYQAQTAEIAALLHRWAGRKTAAGDGVPEKLVYPLEHAYSSAELGFATLKGADAAVAEVLRAAAPRAQCELHLALVSVHESGAAEYVDPGRYAREHRYEAGEVFERVQVLTEWRRGEGELLAVPEIPILDDEVAPPAILDDLAPDEEVFHEATGNAGASFERTYRHAAMVLWPRRRRLAVLEQAGRDATLPYLEQLAARWVDQGRQPGSPPWSDAHVLSRHMLGSWPRGRWRRGRDDDDDAAPARRDGGRSQLTCLLASLTTLGDVTRIEGAIALVTAESGHDRHDNPAILAALTLLPAERAAALLAALVVNHAIEALGACCALLEAAIAGPLATTPEALAGAAAGLIGSLPGDPARAPVDTWGRPRHLVPGAGTVANLVTIAESLDGELAARVATHVIAWPNTYGIDRAVVPALRRLLHGGTHRSGAAMTRLIAAALAHLENRRRNPWSRPGTGAAPAPSPVRARIAGNCGAFWRTRRWNPGRSGPYSTSATTSKAPSSLPASTSTARR